MNFNKHSNLEGCHAYLGASNYHWINYTEEKLVNNYNNYIATLRGTQLHEFAASCIKLGQKLPRSNKTLNMYVNDVYYQNNLLLKLIHQSIIVKMACTYIVLQLKRLH